MQKSFNPDAPVTSSVLPLPQDLILLFPRTSIVHIFCCFPCRHFAPFERKTVCCQNGEKENPQWMRQHSPRLSYDRSCSFQQHLFQSYYISSGLLLVSVLSPSLHIPKDTRWSIATRIFLYLDPVLNVLLKMIKYACMFPLFPFFGAAGSYELKTICSVIVWPCICCLSDLWGPLAGIWGRKRKTKKEGACVTWQLGELLYIQYMCRKGLNLRNLYLWIPEFICVCHVCDMWVWVCVCVCVCVRVCVVLSGVFQGVMLHGAWWEERYSGTTHLYKHSAGFRRRDQWERKSRVEERE